jgi:hypothetical protein
MGQVFHPLRGSVHGQQVHSAEQFVPWAFEGIAAGKRIKSFLEQRGKYNAIQERVWMVGGKQQRAFCFQQGGFVDNDFAAKNAQD